MREILFRAKAINRDEGYHRTNYKNGDWVYGLISRLYDERFSILPAEMTNEDGVSGIEIDHNTVGQYTGLIDRKGNRIFDGDIVKWDGTEISNIRYCDGVYRLCNAKGYYGVSLHNHYSYVEVIGNIHDNPELMKGD